jgi:WD40 repeat protein
MGVVFRAEDVQLQRPVALKAMRPALAAGSDARARFLREGRTMAAVRHDHGVTIHQVGEDRGMAFLAMELLEGESLEERLKREQRLPVEEILRIGRELALGLAAAHGRGLIHRDVKPSNIWLENSPVRVKILDFGLARAATDEGHLTQDGALLGTPAFMAPEQARGEKVDARSDLFSLGCVLYRMATGRLPFRGRDTMSTLMSLANDTPPPIPEINPEVPAGLADLVMRLLARDPAGRPASALMVAEDLRTIERDLTAPKASPARPRRRRVLAAAAGVLAAAVLVAGIIVIIRDQHGNEVARVKAPEGGRAEIREAPKRPRAPKKGKKVAALTPLQHREPLAPTALVQRPVKLPGVRSWSIETRDLREPVALAYRPDGKRLAVSNGSDCNIRIWEPQTGRLVQMLFESNRFCSLEWSPDGRVLAAVDDPNSPTMQPIRLWDPETGRRLRMLEIPIPDGIAAFGWSPDGRNVLAVCPRNGGPEHASCLTWNRANGKLLRKVPMALTPADAFRFRLRLSPDGRRFAGTRSGIDGVIIWDTQTGHDVRKLTGFQGDVWDVDWSPNSKFLACSGADGVRLREAESGKETFHRKDLGPIEAVRWSWDGQALAVKKKAPDPDHRIAVFGRAAESKPQLLEDLGIHGPLAWSPDSKGIARVLPDGSVRLYDAATGKRLRLLNRITHSGNNISFAWSPDTKIMAVSDGLQTYLYALESGQIFASLKGPNAVDNPLAWSPDGKSLAAMGPNNAVQLWDARGQLRHTLAGHQSRVLWLAWSPNGKRLASLAEAEKRVLLWDPHKGERFRELGPFPRAPRDLRWSSDSRLLAINVADADWDFYRNNWKDLSAKQVGWHFWDVEQNKLGNDPKEWKEALFTFTPDGRSALVASAGNQHYRLRDLATGKDRYLSACTCIGELAPAWSPDGRLLAVVAHGGRIELWHADLRRRGPCRSRRVRRSRSSPSPETARWWPPWLASACTSGKPTPAGCAASCYPGGAGTASSSAPTAITPGTIRSSAASSWWCRKRTVNKKCWNLPISKRSTASRATRTRFTCSSPRRRHSIRCRECRWDPSPWSASRPSSLM